MPRVYHRKSDSRKYGVSESSLQLAIEDINAGFSQREVAKKYGITRSTLQNKILGKHKGAPGRPTVLSETEEKTVVAFILKLSDWGFPIDNLDLKMIIKSYLDKNERTVKQFKSNLPGPDWFLNFMKRHKNELSSRLCQNISRKRAEVSRKVLLSYFNNLRETIKDIKPENIVNYDETNLTDDPGKKSSIFRRGVKYPERIMNHTKSATSLMFAASATGELLPVYVVYKAEHLWDTWTKGGPENTRYNRSKSGWFDNTCFTDWFRTVALPFLRRKEGKKLLIGDNLSSHFSESVLEECARNNIIFACLPPNSTHLCQPLDVAFFRPLKTKWRQILSAWKSGGGRRAAAISKDKFPDLLRELMASIDETSKANIISGFRKCGLHPFNPDEVISRIPDDVDEQAVNESFSDSFTDLLKKSRFGEDVDEPNAKKTRRSKVAVSPGKSICGAALLATSTAQSIPRADSEEIIDDDLEAASISSGDSPHDDDSDDADNELQEATEVKIKEGDFVIARYMLKTNCKYFVGRITRIIESAALNDYEVSYLRKASSLYPNIFIFPEKEDIDIIHNSQIKCVLPFPSINRREQFVFNYNFKVMVSS